MGGCDEPTSDIWARRCMLGSGFLALFTGVMCLISGIQMDQDIGFDPTAGKATLIIAGLCGIFWYFCMIIAGTAEGRPLAPKKEAGMAKAWLGTANHWSGHFYGWGVGIFLGGAINLLIAGAVLGGDPELKDGKLSPAYGAGINLIIAGSLFLVTAIWMGIHTFTWPGDSGGKKWDPMAMGLFSVGSLAFAVFVLMAGIDLRWLGDLQKMAEDGKNPLDLKTQTWLLVAGICEAIASGGLFLQFFKWEEGL